MVARRYRRELCRTIPRAGRIQLRYTSAVRERRTDPRCQPHRLLAALTATPGLTAGSPPGAPLHGAANPALSPPAPPDPLRSADAQTPRPGRSTQPKDVPLHTLCATTWSPATTRASPRKPGNAPAAAAPDQPAQQSFEHGRDPTRPAPHRNQGTQSPQQPTATRRGQDQPLPSPPGPPSTTARHPAVPAKTPRVSRTQSVPRHTDGAREQDQPSDEAQDHIGKLNDEQDLCGRHPERRSSAPRGAG